MSSFTNRARAAQLVDFAGLRWTRGARPTDIDLSIDWQGRTFVFGELKGHGKGLTTGQRYHSEGIVRAIRAGGKVAYAVLAHHQTKATEDIIAAEARVHSVYDGETWEHIGTNNLSLQCLLNELHDEHQGIDNVTV